MTQDEASEAAELSPTHWSDIERGRSNPTVTSLLAIAKALGVDIADLFMAGPND